MREASAGRLNLSTESREGAVVVHAEGEVDLDTAETLASALRNAGEPPGSVVVDLFGVPFMDSSGLRTLLVASEELGDRLVLALNPGSAVGHLLEFAAVRDRFEVHPTVEDAIRAGADG